MQVSDATAYFITIVVLTLAPGPLVFLLMIRAASNDTFGAISFGMGVALGDILVISAICLGLGMWLQSLPGVYEFGKFAMLAYIAKLAWDVWNAGIDFKAKDNQHRSGLVSSFVAGCATCVISPQTVILYSLCLPRLIDLQTVNVQSFLLVSLLTFFAMCACFVLVIGFASQLRKLAASPNHVGLINRSLASALMVAGGWMVFA